MSEIAVAIEDEMRSSYIDYAMSVIVGRALPDVRDGLKPVHRRILFAMKEMGLEAGKPYKKSARVVGDVIGKYHPHGDQAVYDALVRMAQPFSMRMPLVDGQGNFGSIDGDPPAAMRYTEVRLASVAGELLADIDKDTVDFVPNYDESLVEPSVLPSRIPNLLINGAQGIAVGMSTSIPPHNLGEVVDALVALIQNPDIGDEELLELVAGPDFPTGGFICGTDGIRDLYLHGKGKIVMRGRVITETDHKSGKTSLVITELPYQVNKAQLVEKIVHLASQKKINGIGEVRDESDRDGIRVVIELKRECLSPQAVVNSLFKLTPLQSSFHANFLALVGGQPKSLNLKELLQQFISFRKDVVTRRTRFELARAEERAHILEGLKIALKNLDAVIKLIRSSKTPEEARRGLMENFKLSEVQAKAILDMRLQRLTALERDKITEEYKEIIAKIAELKEILASERRLMGVITAELLEVKEKYADDRRTEILPEVEELTEEDLIPEETMVVTISGQGFIKRNQLSLFRAQRRGGKGIIGMSPDSEDFVTHLFAASTHDSFLFFTDRGRVYSVPCYQIPQAGRATRGRAITNLLDIERTGERVTAVLPVADFEDGRFVVFLTRR
ncbi:MAG TPA: DNA gyrase subunit A, partial [Proteobacteria bacterium]|nr:DNA gyrase subunit A [Pseudomonadota bacterium]